MKIPMIVTLLFLGCFLSASQGWSQETLCEKYVVLIKLEQMEAPDQSGHAVDEVLEVLNGPLFEIVDETTIGKRIMGLFKPVGQPQEVQKAVMWLRSFKGLIMDCEMDPYQPHPRMTGGN